MPKTTTKTPTQPQTTALAKDAEADFKKLKKRLLAIPLEELKPVSVDCQVSCAIALGVVQHAQAEPLRSRLKNLSKSGEFNDACVDELPIAARAAWYARHRYLLDEAAKTEAKVSLALLDQASALKSRMLRCAEYHLSAHPSEAPVLAAIRVGSGYQDLANDLLALSELYKRQKAELSHDKRNYGAQDAAQAKTLAHQLLEELSQGHVERQGDWGEMQKRAWHLLSRTYGEVARAARFLLGEERGAELFPSLVGASRAAKASKASKDDAEDENEGPSSGSRAEKQARDNG